MGLFGFLRGTDINQAVKEYHEVAGAVLLDVRMPEEYQGGHIPGSKNVPLYTIEKVVRAVSEKNTPIFVYCHSGARSAQAVTMLRRMGYSSVKNIGGIVSYTGKVEF